jgi:hypothetical protein
MKKKQLIEIEGLTLAITRLSAAGKSAKQIENYLECEMLLGGTRPSSSEPAVAAARAPRKVGEKTGGKRTAKGVIGEFILKLLSKKGDEGAHVSEIAQALKRKPAHITTWFYTTGKKIKGIRKVRPNTFAYRGK